MSCVGANRMVPVHQGKVFKIGEKYHQWQFPFVIGGLGSHFVHTQSRGLLLLIGQFLSKETATE